jgi:processing peptidase subunit alpha
MALNTAQLGNSLYNIGARDSFFYGASTFPSQLPLAISLLSSNVLHPLLLPEEIEGAKDAALYETQLMWSSAKQVLPEVVLQTAYKGNTLGMPTALSEEQAQVLGERELRGYLKDWFRPERMVVTGLGMPHEELVDLVTEHFEALGPISGTAAHTAGASERGSGGAVPERKTYATVSNVGLDGDESIHSEYEALSGAVARYTGGEQFIEKPDEQFTHLAIAFEAPKVSDPDVVSVILAPPTTPPSCRILPTLLDKDPDSHALPPMII